MTGCQGGVDVLSLFGGLWGDGLLTGALVATSTDMSVVMDHNQQQEELHMCPSVLF